jgi:hypothetical protein
MYFAGQLGVCWAELGPHYDSPNEAVIPAVAIVARELCAFCRWNPRHRRAAAPQPFVAKKGLLPPLPSGAIMKRR